MVCIGNIMSDLSNHYSKKQFKVMGPVIDKLLSVAVTDTGKKKKAPSSFLLLNTNASAIDATIRQTVLDSLNEKFDEYLSQSSCLKFLFNAMNDEIFEVFFLFFFFVAETKNVWRPTRVCRIEFEH